MLYMEAVTAFFKYKIVSSVIVIWCGKKSDHVHLVRQLSQFGVCATVACNLEGLDRVHNQLLGVLYLQHHNDTLLDQVKPEHFTLWNKWLILGEEIPHQLHGIRYDADITCLKQPQQNKEDAEAKCSKDVQQRVLFEDVHVHPRDGASRHAWATWTEAGGFQLAHERARILRRLDLKRHPMKIVTPVGHYDSYDGTFAQYMLDNSMPEHDSAIRCGYGASSLILEALNAEEILMPVDLWASELGNKTSMTKILADGKGEISGGVLRVLPDRITRFDYITPLWPFSVGFTYLSERESSSNMFVMPFTAAVWYAVAAITVILALALRATAKAPDEKEGAFMSVLATWLQQDASAVPEGASGRATFMVLSVCSMLVYAYYSSAIVSALMSAGGGGPRTLRALADSRYHITSEDYDWIRHLMFDVETTWDELEYLKRRKMTSSFYQSTERGMQLVMEGNTAFHAEYNHIYPLMKIFSDDKICKVQYVDTVPEVMIWLLATKHGQWTGILRSTSNWVHETGLAKRMVSRWKVKPPACRAALLAERVKYGDVAPLMNLTAVGYVASIVFLFAEIFLAKWRKKRVRSSDSEVTILEKD